MVIICIKPKGKKEEGKQRNKKNIKIPYYILGFGDFIIAVIFDELRQGGRKRKRRGGRRKEGKRKKGKRRYKRGGPGTKDGEKRRNKEEIIKKIYGGREKTRTRKKGEKEK